MIDDSEDVCLLSEEVIDSVYVGQRMQKRAPKAAGHSLAESSEQSSKPVMVIVNCAYRPH